MKNVSGKHCRENRNIHIVFNNFFFSPRKSVLFMNNVEKCGRPGQATDDNMAHALACRTTKATKTCLEYLILVIFHGNSGHANAPQCFVYTCMFSLV